MHREAPRPRDQPFHSCSAAAQRFFYPPGEPPQAGKGGQEDREAGGVMPFMHQLDPEVRGAPGQDERAHDIQTEGDDNAAANQGQAVRPAQPVEFAEKQSAHEHGLERADAAARLVNADHTRADLDDIAVLECRDIHLAEDSDRQSGHPLHEALSEAVFDSVGPTDRYQDEAYRERKMPNPRPAARQKDRVEGKGNHAKGERPGEQRPVLVDLVNHTDRKEQKQK